MDFEFNKTLTRGDIPGFLQAMSIANTMATFVFASVLAKVSASKYRSWASFAIVLSWVSIVVAGANYVLTVRVVGSDSALLYLGLVIWVASFAILSFVIFHIATRAVNAHVPRHNKRSLKFRRRFDQPDFGVPLVDDAIRRAAAFDTHIYYPFLLIHDKDSPGFYIGMKFVAAGIVAGDAVIYFSFSRPASIIVRQLRSYAGCHAIEHSNVFVIDCYSRAYMPEEQEGPLRGNRHVLFADPLDPADVYKKYADALVRAHACATTCRAIYETLSDFLKIADAELVLHYLRRTVVYEEIENIKSLYVFWSGAASDEMNERYVPWFFTTTLRLKTLGRKVSTAKFRFTIERLFIDHVRILTDHTLRPDIVPLFNPNAGRIAAFARVLTDLQYRPAPYGFLPRLRDTGHRAMHVANFAFFMAAIDHNTHGDGVSYVGTVAGTFYHGSDLLYALAEVAKFHDEDLFLAPRMAQITNEDVGRMMTTSEGAAPVDVEGRAKIFRDCAKFLIEHYHGDAQDLVAAANHRIAGKDGLVDRLERTGAYGDPVAKKANLLCKLLLREGLFAPVDRDQIDIAVDHVLMTMALRSGMLAVPPNDVLEARLEAGSMLDEYTVSVLRDATKSVFHDVVRASGSHADEVDDLIWSYGRKSLRELTPLPDPAAVASELDGHIQAAAKTAFIAFMNGLDPGAAPSARAIRVVKFPFTRYF